MVGGDADQHWMMTGWEGPGGGGGEQEVGMATEIYCT
jgi:hypothetical protein